MDHHHLKTLTQKIRTSLTTGTHDIPAVVAACDEIDKMIADAAAPKSAPAAAPAAPTISRPAGASPAPQAAPRPPQTPGTGTPPLS